MIKLPLLLIGGGGHCKAAIDVIEAEGKYDIKGIIDKTEKVGQEVLGYPIIGDDDTMGHYLKKIGNFIITVGQIKSPSVRIKLFKKSVVLGGNPINVIAPSAIVSRHAQINQGTIVMHQTFINAGAKIGQNCIINNGALIEHDVEVGNHCHISTQSILNGEVIVGEGVFVGSNATVVQCLSIGEFSLIGANSLVLESIPKNSLAYSKQLNHLSVNNNL